MGQYFTSNIDQIQHQQLEFVPRADDVNGGGPQGGNLIMHPYLTTVLLNAVAITDTGPHEGTVTANTNPTGVPYDQVYAVYKTLAIVSTLNQPVTVQPVWSIDRENWFNLGSTVTVDTGDSNLMTVSHGTSYVPYVGVIVQCAVAPATGVITVILACLG